MDEQKASGPVDRDVGRDVRERLAMMAAGPHWTDTAKSIAREALAELDRLSETLEVIERRLREDTAPILQCIEDHGDSDARRAWQRAIYASAIRAQMALTTNAEVSGVRSPSA